MSTKITIKEIKIKTFRYVGHLTINFVFSDKVHYEEKTIKFRIVSYLLENHKNKILTNEEFLKRLLLYCHLYDKGSILTKDICTKHKNYINNYIFNL